MIRVHWRLLAAGFRRQSTYRAAAFGGLLANVTFGLLKVSLLFATVRAAGGTLQGYDVAMMSTYIWLSQGMLGSVNLYGRSDMATRVKDGQIAIDFLRPVDVQSAAIASELGQSLFTLIPRGIPPVLIGVFAVGMHLPDTPWSYALGALSLLLGITLSIAVVYVIAVVGFWTVETRGLQLFYMVISGFLAGLFVPIQLFPQWLQAIADLTPFPSMLMTQVNVLGGYQGFSESALAVAVQAGWLIAVVAVGQAVTRAGRRHLEVQGG